MLSSVQEEIKLTTEQKEKLEPKIKELDDKQKELFTEFKGKDKETRDKMAEKRKELSEPFVKFVGETLTSEQNTRLKQIHLQRLGIRAFTSEEEVAKALVLTDEQKAKIKAVGDENVKEMGDLRKEMKDNPTETGKKMTALSKEGLDKVLAVLDKAQKTKWEEMTGKPFEYKAEARIPRKKTDN
jgi:hypothetical protein